MSNTVKSRPERDLQSRFCWGPDNPPIFLGRPQDWTEEDRERARKIVADAKAWMEKHGWRNIVGLKQDLREEEKDDDWESNTLRRYRTKYDENWEAEYDSDDI